MELKEEREETEDTMTEVVRLEKSHACSKMSVHGFSPSSGHIPALCESLVRMLARQTRTDSRVLKKEWNVFLTALTYSQSGFL